MANHTSDMDLEDHGEMGLVVLDALYSEMNATVNEAKDSEIDEDFELALTRYEKAGLQYEHLIRLTMKHLMYSAHHVLDKCCNTNPSLHNIWLEYLITSGRHLNAIQFSECFGHKFSSSRRCGLVKYSKTEQDEFIGSHVSEFLSANPYKWTDKKQLNSTASAGMCLDQDQRALLGELASAHLEQNDADTALSLMFCLGESDSVLERYLAHNYQRVLIEEVSQSPSCSQANSLMLWFSKHLASAQGDIASRARSICVSLGLLGEVIRLASLDGGSLEGCVSEALERAEMVADCNSQDKLNSLDPTIEKETLVALLPTLKQENNRDLNTNIICLLLQAIRIFLMKSKMETLNSGHQRPATLERMFECLSLYLDQLEFGGPDRLVGATNSLVLIIKDKLDALADNETIRESFKKLVDTVAGRCLIEARYKSAAILYSQIGDNVNAIKSLMRTGEVQTVVDYALLVRDITVNRITINFMRHLRVEPSVIEDFCTRTRH